MAPPAERYADRVSDNDSEDMGMLSEQSTGRLGFQPTSEKKTAWWKYAIGAAVFAVLLVPAVSFTSSAMLDYKVSAAVQEALASQAAQKAEAATPVPEEPKVDLAKLVANVDGAVEPETLLLSNGSTIHPSNPYGGKRFEIHHCGSNADEARALGCQYDVMMQEWTPAECVDWPLAEKFLKNGNWTWYADSSAEKSYDDVEVALGNHDVVFVAQSYHRHHCIFAWERLVRAMRTGRPLIEKLISIDHFSHCRMNTLMTAEEGAAAVRGVVAPTAFVRCASYDVWLENLPDQDHSTIDRLMKML